MSEFSGMEHIVERVVSQVLQGHLPQLRDELVRRVVEELPAGEEGGAANEFNAADLLRRISVIHAGTTQKEVLRALLDGAARYCGRTALFVIKSGAATGWQARGFDDNESVREFALNVSRGLAERVLSEKASFTGQSIDMDPRFVDHYGSPASEHVLLLPLLVKEKVAALLYADGGMDVNRHVESAAIELLVQFAGHWLELSSLRKQAPRDAYASNERMETIAPPPPAAVSAPSFNDPFAGHAPAHSTMAAAAPARAPEPPVMVAVAHVEAQAEAANAEPVIADPVSAPAIAEPAAETAPAMSAEDADTHRKAQRFARLLVDEIKLYNSAKVAEGRKNKDLYDRLKEDIEKSRATYKKRYGSTVAANADYFQVELVRSLAEDDASIMGPNFRR
jgi:hypothetical protein